MQLVADVPDVRVVVGFMESEVIDELARVRPDAIVVRNPAFRVTTTLHSYAMGAQGMRSDCLFMDADILVVPETFDQFVAGCREGQPRLARRGRAAPMRSMWSWRMDLSRGSGAIGRRTSNGRTFPGFRPASSRRSGRPRSTSICASICRWVWARSTPTRSTRPRTLNLRGRGPRYFVSKSAADIGRTERRSFERTCRSKPHECS